MSAVVLNVTACSIVLHLTNALAYSLAISIVRPLTVTEDVIVHARSTLTVNSPLSVNGDFTLGSNATLRLSNTSDVSINGLLLPLGSISLT